MADAVDSVINALYDKEAATTKASEATLAAKVVASEASEPAKARAVSATRQPDNDDDAFAMEPCPHDRTKKTHDC